jgi:hypothetical protein
MKLIYRVSKALVVVGDYVGDCNFRITSISESTITARSTHSGNVVVVTATMVGAQWIHHA